jgi:alpha 1,3-mannosyltransferase
MYGDKETFWIGFLLAGDEGFAFHSGDAASMGIAKPVPVEKPQKAVGSDPDAPELEDEPPEDPDAYEMCAPQLLHLDVEGKPLWFNGWIMDNKFAEKGKRNFAVFETYLVEPRDMREPTAWQLKENNLCCLTSDKDKHIKFSVEDKATLDGIVEHAKNIGMAV